MAGTGSPLPHLENIERLSPLVIRILGGNPGKFTLQGTNTYLVGRGRRRILIDTGEGRPVWTESLRKVLADENAEVAELILTHWHPDHVGGVADVRELAGSQSPKIFKNRSHLAELAEHDIIDGQVFRADGATLRAVHSPGHTVDHIALVLDEEDAMFTGDNVLGHGTAVFEDLAAYLRSLDTMVGHFAGRAYPGHGAVLDDGPAKIREYIAHRREREEQILKVMEGESADADQGWTAMAIVKIVYKDYPENLHGPAEGGVVQVLKKLEGDGKLRGNGQTWNVTPKSTL